MFSACSSSSKIVTTRRVIHTAFKPNHTNTSSRKYSSSLVKQIINSAEDQLGTPYKSGGTTAAGFDCSGLIFATFKKYDILLPRSAVELAEVGQKISKKNIQKGDLIFFKTNGKNGINHVGLAVDVDNDDILFIHSSIQKGVIISSTKEPYYNITFCQANRILQ